MIIGGIEHNCNFCHKEIKTPYVCMQHQWFSTPTIYFCMECFLYQIGDQFLPEYEQDFYCHLCEEPVQAGSMYVKITHIDKDSRSNIYHQECFVECSGGDVWIHTVKLF